MLAQTLEEDCTFETLTPEKIKHIKTQYEKAFREAEKAWDDYIKLPKDKQAKASSPPEYRYIK